MILFALIFYDRSGTKILDHVEAANAQAAADCIRKGWPKCYILRISQKADIDKELNIMLV